MITESLLLQFDVVSTTQKPPDSLKSEETLLKQFENFQENIKDKLKALESANALQLEQLTHRLEALESTNNLKLQDGRRVLDSKQKELFCLKQQPRENLPRNCREVKERGYDFSTTYPIKPDFAPKATKVRCDLEKHGGGWTYILNRFDGSQSFDFDIEEYKNGFGKLSGEFWLGLDNINYLTGKLLTQLTE